MRIEVGQTVLLGHTSYTVIEKLGSGAVTDVYRARLAEVPTDVVVKVVRQDTTPDEEGHRKVEGVRREAQVLTTLNQAENPLWSSIVGIPDRVRRVQQTVSQRLVVALFDSGEIAPDRPYLVQELAPPALERFDVETLADERRILSVVHAMARAMALAHQHNLALKDFDPRTKLDRVRVRWLDEEDRFELKLIDWNVTGGTEDMPQDLFHFGGHLYYLLLGYHLVLDVAGCPPATLGLGVPGWEWLTEGSRQILQRLLHRDPARRYRRAAELEADLAWWLDALRQADTPNAVDRLQDRIWQARPQERHDRVLAVAELAQRLDLSTEARRMFELWADQARQELEKETWLPIADARVSLLSGAYMAAVEKFSTQLRQLDERSEAARMARLLRFLAKAGHLLKQASQGADIRPTAEWAALTRAANALVQRQWDEARTALLEVERLRPEAANWQPVLDQLDLAQAGHLLNQAAELSAQAEPRRADADRTDWVELETKHLERLEQAVTLLQQAVELAPLEPDFKDRLQTEQAHLELRRALLTRYRDAEQFVEQATSYLQRGQDAARRNDDDAAAIAFAEAVEALDNALAEVRAILEADVGQYRARRLQEQIQRQRVETQRRLNLTQALAQALAQAHDLVRQGRYTEALEHARCAADLALAEIRVQNLLAEVEVGARLEDMVRTYLETGKQYLEAGNFEQAKSQARQVLDNIRDKPLADLIEEALPPEVRIRLFKLQPELNKQAVNLLDEARYTGEVHSRVRDSLDKGDYEMVITPLREKAKRYDLTTQEKQWLDHARSRRDELKQAQKQLAQAQTFDDLRQVLELAPSDDPSPLAAEIRYRTGTAWRRLVTVEPDPGKAARVLREGQRRFEGLEIAKSLGAMLELAEVGHHVQGQLEIVPDTNLPTWFDLPESDLAVELARLDADLTKLTHSDKWPALQETARGWRNQLVTYLTTYLRPRRDEAQTALTERNFDEALNVAERAWALVPKGLHSDLPPDVGRDGISRIKEGVKVRKQAEGELKTLVQALAAGARSFIEVAESTQAISLPDGEFTNDLRVVITELERGATWEQALERVLDADTYAKGIRERQIMADKPFPLPEEEWVRLTDALKTLRERLRASVQLAGQTLLSDLQTEVKALIDHPEQPEESQKRSREKTLKLYWQARWLAKSSGRADAFSVVDTLPGTVRALADKAMESFDSFLIAHQRGDLSRAHSVLGTVEFLNEGLATLPVINGKPLVELPPLPQGVEYKSLPTPFDPRALERFRQGVDEFIKLASRGGLPNETSPLSAVTDLPTDAVQPAVPGPPESASSPSPEETPPEEVAPPEPMAIGTAWRGQIKNQ